ncbi:MULTISPECIES: GW dipeptide domain-containing protein [Lacticaseibacillus]|uniref:GW dipeptide domain-containing protein n=1 Tax=Lacticaseibacillus TaxID=2759736 RepID=UPI000A8D138B|nr:MULTISPECIES: GW dipeptide domain-containing protein [Lacticaseibacillus]
MMQKARHNKRSTFLIAGIFSAVTVGLLAPTILEQRVYADSTSTAATDSSTQDFHLTNEHSNLDANNHVLGESIKSQENSTNRAANARSFAATDSATTQSAQASASTASNVLSFTIGDTTVPRVDTVDVASYQSGMTQANYNKLKELGVKAVIVKASEGSFYRNPYASSQLAQAQSAGLKVAAYHYVHFANQSDAISEAKYFADTLDSLGFSKNYPVVADVEDSDVTGNVSDNLNAFWDTLSARGYSNHVVYTGRYYTYSDAIIKTVGNSKAWIAQYPYTPSANNLWNTGYGAWQFSSSAMIPGYSSRVDVSIDYRGIFTNTLDPILSSSPLSGVKQIDQTNRKDGIYSAPYNTAADATTQNQNGVQYNGDMVQLIQQATTRWSTYVQVKASNGQTFWIDQAALKDPKPDPILAKTSENYYARIDQSARSDGLYVGGPYRTVASAYVANTDAAGHNDDLVHVIATERTSWSTFAEVEFNDGTTYWIDTGALKRVSLYPTLSQQNVSYDAVIDETNRQDGIYESGPYGSSDAALNANANGKQYDGKAVHVSVEVRNAWSTYVQVTTAEGTKFWIDKAAIKPITLYSVLSTTDQSYTATIDQSGRSDGIYSAPYATTLSSYAANGDAQKYNGQTVQVLKTATTAWSTYVLVKTSSGDQFWIDKMGIQSPYFPTLSQTNVSYDGLIDETGRTDGVYVDGPYNSNAATSTVNGDGVKYNGQPVHVSVEATNQWSTYAKVTLTDGNSFWIDKIAIKPLPTDTIVESHSVNYRAMIDQSTRTDGVYLNGPYRTSYQTYAANVDAKKYDGQQGTVKQEVTTTWSTYVQIQLDSGAVIWLDKAGIRSV